MQTDRCDVIFAKLTERIVFFSLVVTGLTLGWARFQCCALAHVKFQVFNKTVTSVNMARLCTLC